MVAGEEMVCGYCKMMLYPFTHPDGHVEWIHGDLWRSFDHDPEPVPRMLVGDEARLLCDFCGTGEGVRWLYKGERVTSRVVLPIGLPVERNDSSDWAGCDACDRFVRRGGTSMGC